MKLEPTSLRLQFAPLDRLLLHEEDDPYRVKRLVLALKRDGRLRNPPLVAEQGSDYFVLDGATRTTALREMGFRDVLVQIVEYESEAVQLSAWHHVVDGMPQNRLLAQLADLDGVTLQPVDAEAGARMLASREIVACVVMRNGQQFAVLCAGDICQQARMLCRLVAEYRGRANVHRTIEVDMPVLIREYPDLTAVVVFPHFTPAEIVEIARNGEKVPMGITRHIVAGRALGLGVPLELLTDAQTLEAKNAWLDDLIQKRLRANQIRLYQEPVFVFDE